MQRWSRRALLLGGVALLGAGCTYASAGQVPYSLSVGGEGNVVTILPETGTTASYTIRVASVRGIGQAIVAWWGQVAPQQLTFRLELKGLERFQLRWGDTLINVSINASTQHIMQSVQKGEATEEAILAASPFWMKTILPPAGGSGFTVLTPSAFAQEGPRLWAFAWVDFYR